MKPAVVQTSNGFLPLREPSLARGGKLSAHDALTKQTQTWVAQSFFGTLLKQMRDSPFKSDILDGGRGGQAFSGLYDQHLAERMSRGVGHKLVGAIVRKIEAKNAYTKQMKMNRAVTPGRRSNAAA
ncbi:MAG TPA: rod-binding protein [Tepidisphaeraceae bacterium]|jgi:Rod binding domain-containing protein|nr:rod-binding protein [Tepidisphaeraceae bacterium]